MHQNQIQPCSANDSVSDSSNIPLQGAFEVLSFIKECIFLQIGILLFTKKPVTNYYGMHKPAYL